MKTMERKISSSLTEFYKVYGILCVAIFFAIFGFRFFDLLDLQFFIFLSIIAVINLMMAFDFWRMKEVEMTDAGLLISSRFFFRQKTIFVPYENVEEVKKRLWWLGNLKRISIKFKENTDFGGEISFITKGFTRHSQTKIYEELSRAVARNQTARSLGSSILGIDN